MSVFLGKDEPPILLSLIGLIIIITVVVGKLDSVSFLGGIIALLCARQCHKWSRKINRKGYWGYFIGLLFSLLGLLAYYLFYKNKLKDIVMETVHKPAAKAKTPEQKAKRKTK